MDDHHESDLPRGLAAPARRALVLAGITQLSDLTAFSEGAVSALHGMGPRAMRVLRDAMALRGMAFTDDATPRAIASALPDRM